MKFFKQILGRLLISKKRQKVLEEFVVLLKELPKVTTVEECMAGYKKVAEFNKLLSDKKKDLWFKDASHKLLEYLLDTKTHIHNGYHKPSYNGWKTVTTYPDINDYIKLDVHINTF